MSSSYVFAYKRCKDKCHIILIKYGLGWWILLALRAVAFLARYFKCSTSSDAYTFVDCWTWLISWVEKNYWEATMPQAMTCCIMTATHNAKSVNPNSMTHAHCWSVQALSPFYKMKFVVISINLYLILRFLF